MGRVKVSRRSVLLASVALPLAGCGIRLESDAPRILGTPSPDPAGPALAEERDRVAAVVAAASTLTSPLVDGLLRVHEQQARALDRALASLDPPLEPTSPSTVLASPSGSGSPTVADVADLEYAGLDEPGLATLDDLLPRVAEVVVASHAQRAVAVNLLRAARVRGGGPLPDLPWAVADRDIGLRLVEALRSTAYGFEVVAARTDPTRRAPLVTVLARLRSLETAVGAEVDDLPPRPLGHPLPGRPGTPPAGATLIDGMLSRLAAVAVGCATDTSLAVHSPGAPAHSAPPGPTEPASPVPPPSWAMASLIRLATFAETTRITLGGALRPLPRLAAPAPATPVPTNAVTGSS